MNDFITDHLTRKQRQIAQAVLKVLPPDATGGGCSAFHHSKEWKARGEQYGTNSLLVICHDGGDLAPYFNFDYCEYNKIEEMRLALEKLGLFSEACTSWYSAVYEK